MPAQPDEQPKTGPTDEQILEGITGFLLPLARLVRQMAADAGLTPEQLLAEFEAEGGDGSGARPTRAGGAREEARGAPRQARGGAAGPGHPGGYPPVAAGPAEVDRA